MINEHPIRTRYQAVRPLLDERGRRLHVAAEAISAGYGGVAAASRATKIARSTIGRGIKDLLEPGSLTGKVRRKGAGRPTATAKDATLLSDLERLLETATMGDPMRPLRWVSNRHQELATALCAIGHQVSASTITKLLERFTPTRPAWFSRSAIILPAPRVESRTGAVAVASRWVVGVAFARPRSPGWPGSVFCPRSSNRTCRFPASGFHLRHQAFALGRSARRSGK